MTKETYLDHLHVIDPLKDGIEKGDLLNDQVLLLRPNDIHTVTNVIRMFDEEENARSEELLCCNGEDEG